MGVVKYTGPMASFHCPTNANINSLKVHFSPKQLGEGDPSPNNVREIQGWDGVDVYFTKNLLNLKSSIGYPDNKDKYNTNKRIFQSGQIIIGSSWSNYYNPAAITSYNITNSSITQTSHDGYGIGFTFNVRPGDEYQLTGIVEGNLQAYVTYYKYDGTAIIYGEIDILNKDTFVVPQEAVIMIISFTVPWNASVKTATITNPVLQLKSDLVQEYFPINISFPSTIYGGSVDLITGEVISTHYCLVAGITNTFRDATLATIQQIGDYTRFWIGIAAADGLPTRKTGTVPIYCNMTSVNTGIGYVDYNKETNLMGAVDQYPQSVWCTMPTSVVGTTKETINNYLNTNHFSYVFEMKTPLTYQLTPQQLQTFLGQNNIWSNADYVEVEYDLYETQDILARKQFIIANQPHLEEVNKSILTFNTDMSAPLKECKIYFSPVQEGSGDASPDNVRGIRGWDEIEVTQCGKNLFDKNNFPIINGYFFNTTDTNITNSVDHVITYVPCESNTVYTISRVRVNPSTAWRFNVAYSNETPSYTTQLFGINQQSSFTNINPGERCNISILTGANAKYLIIYLCWKNMERVENAAETLIVNNGSNIEYESYKGQTYSLDWASSIGTIYGGHVDLVKGKLVQEWTQVKINSLSWTYQTSGQCFRSSVPMKRENVGKISPIKNSIYKTINVDGTISNWRNKEDYSISEHIGTQEATATLVQSIHIKDSRYTTVNDFLNGVGNEDIIYTLLVPIEYDIDPVTLKALRGINNIWSTANGPIKLKYWTY